MTAQEYAAMYRAVPTRHGLAAVGNAFLLESKDRTKALTDRAVIESVGNSMRDKWREFCELVSDVEPAPQREAFDGLVTMLLHRNGF